MTVLYVDIFRVSLAKLKHCETSLIKIMSSRGPK